MTTELYGYLSNDIEGIRASIEQALAVTFRSERTPYRVYYAAGIPGAELLLQRNWDGLDEELMEAAYPQVGVVLYVIAQRTGDSIMPGASRQFDTPGQSPGVLECGGAVEQWRGDNPASSSGIGIRGNSRAGAPERLLTTQTQARLLERRDEA